MFISSLISNVDSHQLVAYLVFITLYVGYSSEQTGGWSPYMHINCHFFFRFCI